MEDDVPAPRVLIQHPIGRYGGPSLLKKKKKRKKEKK